MTGTTNAYGAQHGARAGAGQQQHRSGGGHLAGKVEHGMGEMVGSKALEARGLEKEQSVSSLSFHYLLLFRISTGKVYLLTSYVRC